MRGDRSDTHGFSREAAEGDKGQAMVREPLQERIRTCMPANQNHQLNLRQRQNRNQNQSQTRKPNLNQNHPSNLNLSPNRMGKEMEKVKAKEMGKVKARLIQIARASLQSPKRPLLSQTAERQEQ